MLNFSAMSESDANRGHALDADHWHVYGLVVEHAGDNGIFIGGSHNIVERTVTRATGTPACSSPDLLRHPTRGLAGRQPDFERRVAPQRRL